MLEVGASPGREKGGFRRARPYQKSPGGSILGHQVPQGQAGASAMLDCVSPPPRHAGGKA